MSFNNGVAFTSAAEIPPEPLPPKALESWTPSQFINWTVPEGFVLSDDGAYLVRGSIVVIGGAPGTGKSRSSVGLAIAGATGRDWFNVRIKARFKTLIVQNENGPFRLKSELADIKLPPDVDLDDYLRITLPPPRGLAFDDRDFLDAFQKEVESFQPSVVVIDPWNAASGGEGTKKDYRDALDAILSRLPAEADRRPVVAIVHHLRKTGANQNGRRAGRELLNELAGSYSLGGAARTVWILEPASSDPEDDRVVLTNCKANDADELSTTAWHRKNGLFAQCEEFNFDEFFSGTSKPKGISLDDVREVIESAQGIRKADLVAAIMDTTGKKKSAAYSALDRYADHITEAEEGKLWWKK